VKSGQAPATGETHHLEMRLELAIGVEKIYFTDVVGTK
jgi:hypothetical protein